MGTRGAIVRLVSKDPVEFVGVYHHWDSYPEGLGHTLFHLYNEYFEQDLNTMLKTLIDEHPAGWSTIVGADFALKPGFFGDENRLCVICEQNFDAHIEWPEGKGPGTGVACISDTKLGHTYEISETRNPQCYCHGDRQEEGQEINESNASGCGCEYVYAFDNTHMYILVNYNEDSSKMVGMWGAGNPNATWKICEIVNLDEKEPDWSLSTF